MSIQQLLTEYWPVLLVLVSVITGFAAFRIETKKDVASIQKSVSKLDSDVSIALRKLDSDRREDANRQEDNRRLDIDKQERRYELMESKIDGVKDLITQVLITTSKNSKSD